MKKIKVGVIFGGMSTEHDVSIVSGLSVVKNLDKNKYDVYPIYIDNDGTWYKYNVDINKIVILNVGDELDNIEIIDNVLSYIKNMDVIFPVLHGLYGEDGTIQGMLELLKVPYVGCKVLASCLSMDKVYTKIIFEKAGLNQTPYVYIKKYNDKYILVDDKFNEEVLSLNEIINIVDKKLKYPLFVKPSNSGSSVGISKASKKEELESSINEAIKYDFKILIEQGVFGKEVECAVLGNNDVIAGSVGEIRANGDFYSFDSKYKDNKSYTLTKADIDPKLFENVKKLAIKAFKAVDGKGLSRVDFFIEDKTNKIIINEINTMPGFTNISMYPKLFEEVGISYQELLDRLITLSLDKTK